MCKITCFGSFWGHEGDEERPARIRAQIRERKKRHIREETGRVWRASAETAASMVPISTEHANIRPPAVSD